MLAEYIRDLVPGRGHALGRRRAHAIRRQCGVEIGGVSVVPGDYVFADASEAVVIPRASLQRVIDEALGIEAEDARSLQQIATELPASCRFA